MRARLFACFALLAACAGPEGEERRQATSESPLVVPSAEVAVGLDVVARDIATAKPFVDETAVLTAAAASDVVERQLPVIGEETRTLVFKQRDANDEAKVRFQLPDTAADEVRVALRRDGETVGAVRTLPGSTRTLTVAIPTGERWHVVASLFRDGKLRQQARSVRVVVGDIFLVAGQSNSTNAGDGSTTSQSDGAFMHTGNGWAPARDPFLTADTTRGSSPWPSFADAYFWKTKVPAAVVSLGWAGTSIAQWQPGNATNLFKRLRQYAEAFGARGFRAVLWHQGESDVFVGTAGWQYRAYLQNIISRLRDAVDWQGMPWVVASASYIGEKGWSDLCASLGGKLCVQQIALRQREVLLGQTTTADFTSNVIRGPGTDALWTRVYRADQGGSYIHFNVAGQQRHGWLWYEALEARLPSIK